jgi:hypothetical protein
MFCPPQTHNDSSFPTSSYGGCPCALWGFRCMSLPVKNPAPSRSPNPVLPGKGEGFSLPTRIRSLT